MANEDYRELHEQIGNRVKSERETLGWSQGDLSREAGVTQPRISEIESGKKAMYLTTAMKIADALAIPIDWLVKGD